MTQTKKNQSFILSVMISESNHDKKVNRLGRKILLAINLKGPYCTLKDVLFILGYAENSQQKIIDAARSLKSGNLVKMSSKDVNNLNAPIILTPGGIKAVENILDRYNDELSRICDLL